MCDICHYLDGKVAVVFYILSLVFTNSLHSAIESTCFARSHQLTQPRSLEVFRLCLDESWPELVGKAVTLILQRGQLRTQGLEHIKDAFLYVFEGSI